MGIELNIADDGWMKSTSEPQINLFLCADFMVAPRSDAPPPRPPGQPPFPTPSYCFGGMCHCAEAAVQ